MTLIPCVQNAFEQIGFGCALALPLLPIIGLLAEVSLCWLSSFAMCVLCLLCATRHRADHTDRVACRVLLQLVISWKTEQAASDDGKASVWTEVMVDVPDRLQVLWMLYCMGPYAYVSVLYRHLGLNAKAYFPRLAVSLVLWLSHTVLAVR